MHHQRARPAGNTMYGHGFDGRRDNAHNSHFPGHGVGGDSSFNPFRRAPAQQKKGRAHEMFATGPPQQQYQNPFVRG